jgi:hypothetical protein
MKIAFPSRRKIVLALAAVILVTPIAFVGIMDFVFVMPRIRERVGVSLSTMVTQAQACLTRRLLEHALESRDPARHMALAYPSGSASRRGEW